jgi:hypothetical protein
VVVGSLLLLWLVLFAPNFSGRPFVLGDAASYRPYAEFARERFATTHDRTLWNPYVFLGIPSAASLADPRPQWAPNFVLGAWDGLTGDPVTALRMLLLGILAGALAAAWLARVLWSASPPSMVLAGGTLMTASGLAGPLAFGHDAQAWSVALTPVVLLATCWLFAARRELLALPTAGLALSLALLVFAGHPQFLVYGVLLALVFALERQRPRRLLWFAAAMLLGLAMSAGSWLPAWNYGTISVRNDAEAMAKAAESFSANGLDLLALAWPNAAGHGGAAYHGGLRVTDFPNHVGFVVLGLALIGAFAGGALKGRRTAIVLAAVTAFALLAALGTHLPLIDGILRIVPVLRSFRTPVTWLIPASLLLGLLAARGLTLLSTRAALSWVLAVAALVEMSVVTVPILRAATGPVARLQPATPDSLAAAAQGDPLHRSVSFDARRYFSNDWISWRTRSVSGLHGATTASWNDLRTSGVLLRGGFMRATATRWLFHLPASLLGSTGIRPTASGHMIDDTLPRAYAVRRVETVSDRTEMLKRVGNPRFDASAVAFSLDPALQGDYSQATIEWKRDDPDRLALGVNASDRCFVVVADAWAPGWTAHIDGRPAPITLVDAALRGVALPGGAHVLEMTYLPPGWSAGRILAGFGWLAWAVLGAWALVKWWRLAAPRLDRTTTAN